MFQIYNGKSLSSEIEDIKLLIFYYPQFRDELPILIENKVIRKIKKDNYTWVYSHTSCAEYFKSRKGKSRGNFRFVEKVFGIPKDTLRHLSSTNGNRDKREFSMDFEEILKILD
ncbi:hypothetical protein FACS1894141_0380 [Spirochaetia bacterium]|nr:hypothetical protein FACS1894141_0380 [Spirochaetia bacterium]